jgi:hypothetical protein
MLPADYTIAEAMLAGMGSQPQMLSDLQSSFRPFARAADLMPYCRHLNSIARADCGQLELRRMSCW